MTYEYICLINISKKLALNNNTDRAIAVLKKALKIDSTRIEAYYGLGYCYTQNCYENKLNCDKGIHYLNICIEKDKNYRNALFNRATCKSNLGNLKGALVDLNNAIKKDSTDSDYFMNRAWVKLQLKDTVGTCLDYKRAIKLGEVKGNKRFKNLCTQK